MPMPVSSSAHPPPGKVSPNQALRELSERSDGPALIAVAGEDAPGSEFQLGTRETGWHSHVRGQIFWIEDGLVHVRTRHGSWLLPPHRAGWIPPGVLHMATINGVMRGWNMVITPEASRHLPATPCVIGVSE